MKLIKAYIRHRKVGDIYNALKKAGFCCMTFVECEGDRYCYKDETCPVYHIHLFPVGAECIFY
jgi:nitrogen regulatory protein PII